MLSGLHNLWQPGSWAARKWRENGKIKRKWRENEEMVRKWGNEERFALYISLFSFFPPSLSISYTKIVSFCRKMLNTALLSLMSQKKLNIRAMKKIILGRIRCEKAPQVVPACHDTYYKHAPDHVICNISMPLICVLAVYHPLLSN